MKAGQTKPGRDAWLPACHCGHAASTHGLGTSGRTQDMDIGSRGGRYLCRNEYCVCDGYNANWPDGETL